MIDIFGKNIDDGNWCCERCRNDANVMRSTMIVCPYCGNKRCPKAEFHKFKCSGSNSTNQVGELE